MEAWPATGNAILGALMSGPKHGYEILQFLGEGLGSAWRFSTSQLYVLLKRLEHDGWVTSVLETQDTRPPKRVFSLTPVGEGMFLTWLRTPTAHVRDLRIEFLAKLFFFHKLGLQGGDAMVDDQIALMEHIKNGVMEKEGVETDSYKRLVYSFRAFMLEGWITWLKNEARPFVKGGLSPARAT